MIKIFYGKSLDEIIEAVNGFEEATGQKVCQFRDFTIAHQYEPTEYGMIVAFKGPCGC